DPGLTVRLPLVDRPGESLLVWTTTPWTLAANVAAAVGPDLEYARIRQGDQSFWVGKGRLKQAVVGPFEGLETKVGRERVVCRVRVRRARVRARAGGRARHGPVRRAPRRPRRIRRGHPGRPGNAVRAP